MNAQRKGRGAGEEEELLDPERGKGEQKQCSANAAAPPDGQCLHNTLFSR